MSTRRRRPYRRQRPSRRLSRQPRPRTRTWRPSSPWRPSRARVRGELLGLRWGDWDQDAGTLTVERAVISVKGALQVKATKTHGVRRLACDPFTDEVLKRHRAIMEERAEDAGVELADDGPVFSYDLQRPIHPDTVSHYVRDLADKAGVDIHVHQLRHFAATQLVSGGTDVRTVAGRLGHATPVSPFGSTPTPCPSGTGKRPHRWGRR